ncbi:MAG: hypothetical protein K0R65_1674 [Crocinitomicaceae bacterium]|jgi:two-component system phosphate regulon sensor histidine kinase PhoR|nr:hypothetical protein [Crocinitomicaceae bacterium]
MNRYKLLAVSFALVLIGTLAIQAYWIFSVIEIKNKQFDDAVFNALQSTVEALEQRENITFIKHLETDSIVKGHNPGAFRTEKIQIIRKSNTSDQEHRFEYQLDSDSLLHESQRQKELKTIVLSSDTMMHVRLREEDHKLATLDAKLSKINVLIHKMATDESDFLLKIPEGKEVEQLLASRLRKHNVKLPFSLGMKLHEQTGYQSPEADSAALFSSAYSTEIFPDDVLKREGRLYVDFPGKNAYIFSNILWLLLVLVLFTASLIFMFYATLSNYKKQKKLNAIKSDFINNMTHEFKTPLATIQVASDIILKQSADPGSQVHQMARAIKEQGKRIDEDVKNMLQSALLESSGSMELHYSHFNLGEAMEETRRAFHLLAAQKEVEVEILCRENLPVEADKDLLGKALNNLLDNAIKYSPQNGRIILEAQNSGASVEITVKDSGSGIAKEDLPYVFDRFYRAGQGNIHYNKGYGLGLSFVRKIVELHGGKAEIKSGPGQGTEVKLTIPQKR